MSANRIHQKKNFHNISKIGVLLFYLLTPNILIMSQVRNIEFQNIRVGEEIGTNYIRCIIQDDIGFLWVGTKNGLYKYDGYDLTSFKHDSNNPNSLSTNYINCLIQDKNGMLWIATSDGLNKYEIKSKHFTNFHHDPNDKNTICNSNVSAICEDENGIIWIGTPTGLDMLDTKSKTFTHFVNNESDSESLSNNQINCLFKDKNGNILIGTDNGGLNKIIKIQKTDDNSKTEYKFQRLFTSLPSNLREKCNAIYSIHEDKTGDLWIGLAYGFVKYNPDSNYYKFYDLNDGVLFNSNQVHPKYGKDYFVKSIVETEKEILWLATIHGLFKFDKKDESLVYFLNVSNNYQYVSNNNIYNLFVDRSGILWIGTKGSGLVKLLPVSMRFNTFSSFNEDKNKINIRSIRTFLEDSKGNIWVGGYFGINKINTISGKTTHYLSNKSIYTMCKDPHDPDNIFWISSENEGLCKFNTATGKLYEFRREKPELETGGLINCLVFDNNGYLWIGSENGLSRFDKQNSRIVNYKNIPGDPFSLSNNVVRTIYQDKTGYFWIGTDNGLNLFDYSSNKFIRIMSRNNYRSGLSKQRILSIFEDQKNNLWIGTNDGGLNKLKLLSLPKNIFQKFDYADDNVFEFIHYTENDGLPDNTVYGILQDYAGNLWLSTNKGISRFNPEKKTFRNFDVKNGLQDNEFNKNAYFKGKNGEMFFGGVKGFNTFYPNEFSDTSYNSPVVLTKFELANKVVPVGAFDDERVILDKNISLTDEIELTYQDYVFSFEFAALNYFAPEKIRYAYLLEGANNEWVDLDNHRSITFSNVPAGNYVFKVRATNSSGEWQNQVASVRLIITPPFWDTKFAYLIYFILAVALIYGIIYSMRKKEKEKIRLKELEHQAEIEKAAKIESELRAEASELRINEILASNRAMEAEYDKFKAEVSEAEKRLELYKMQTHFLENISHELRTPLSLILGPLEKIRAGKFADSLKSQYDVMLRNGQRMLQLVNQLLDISKLRSGQVKLDLQRSDIINLAKVLFDSFKSIANKKNIKFKLDADYENLYLFIDRDKVEKIIINLLSNAFKFTKNNGKILFAVKSKGDAVEIIVADSGIGISAENINKIFDRFYRVSEQNNTYIPGTGIGLAIVKEMIELHHGKIFVESVVNKGTCFVVLLPAINEISNFKNISLPDFNIEDYECYKKIFEESNLVVSASGEKTNSDIVIRRPASAEIESALSEDSLDKDFILIVEDNKDMRQYIRESLPNEYSVLEAENGVEGFEIAINKLPNLIISDQMMPEMDGLTLCSKLKDDDRTCHIPIILLSSKAGAENKIIGLLNLADAYITKPFNKNELLAQINNLIEQRKKIFDRHNRQSLLPVKEMKIQPADKKFINRVVEIIDANISEPELNLDTLREEMALGKTQFYRKIKALTGKSPNDFIRTVRLERSIPLLKNKFGNISEIAYDVGFQNPSYFSECFKKHFGISPSEFLSAKQ